MRIIERKEVPGLAKLYLARFDGDPRRLAEFVDTLEPGVPKSRKWVMMVSTQFGCPVGCRMCDAGAMGYHGDLSPDQIVRQVRAIARLNPGLDMARHPKVKVHFARMGEPSLNPGVVTALRMLAREFPGPGLLPSLSTVAPLSSRAASFFDELPRLKDELFADGRLQLQFSLHSLDEGLRRRIVPVKTWSLEQVADYGARFVRPGDRKITLNFALAAGEGLDAPRLAACFSPEKFLVKITPINPTETATRGGAAHVWLETPDHIKACADRLASRGFQVILSPSTAEEIAAETSCGQLWSRAMKDRAVAALKNKKREQGSYVTAASLPRRVDAWKEQLRPWRRRRFALTPGKAGLLVVDLQRLFLDPDSPAYLPPARAILANAVRLARAFRKARRPVYFTVHAHRDPANDAGLMTRWWRKVCLSGAPEARLAPALDPGAAKVFRKCRYNAFTSRALKARLRRDGVEELVVAGVATNLCVESTVRGAFDLGIQPFVVVDATAAHAEELHVGALRSMAFGLAPLCDTEEVRRALSSRGK